LTWARLVDEAITTSKPASSGRICDGINLRMLIFLCAEKMRHGMAALYRCNFSGLAFWNRFHAHAFRKLFLKTSDNFLAKQISIRNLELVLSFQFRSRFGCLPNLLLPQSWSR
jgi:hypothetical protein